MAESGERLVVLARQCLRSLPDASTGVVVAVSGGADSVALLRALDAARDPRNPLPLVLAHLNHQLRGRDSEEDEQFVRDLHAHLVAAGRPALHLAHCRIDMAAHAAGDNLEATMRRERYRWLAKVARSHGMGWIATGHTANDQAETVLHRLLRGTGLRGLRGIAPRRELEPGIVVIRPILAATRASILAYLDSLSQAYREDASNCDVRFTRNRIRHELLPYLLREYNPSLVRVLASLAEQAEETYRDEEEAALSLLAEAELPRAGTLLVFDAARLLTAPRHRVRALLRLLWPREGWSLSGMDFAAWQRAAEVVFGGAAAVDLSGGLHIRRAGRVVQIGPRDK